MFDKNMLKSFGMEEMMAAQEQTATAWKNATTALTEGMTKVQAQQMEQTKQWLQESMSAAQSVASAKSADEMFSKQAQVVQQMAQAQLAASQEIASLFNDAATKATDIMTKQMMQNMNAYSAQAKKMASSMTSSSKTTSAS